MRMAAGILKGISITICDDERAQIDYLSALVRKWADVRSHDVRITEFESAEGFLFSYEEDKTADILLLDIQMKGLDGVALARRIRQDNDAVQIVFITGYPDYMAQGYDVSALHYLMKTVKEDKLFEVLDKAVSKLKKEQKLLLVDSADGTIRIPQNDILFVEAFAHSVAIQTKNTVVETRISISEIEKLLDGSFIRCHRSYIVGLRHIGRITKTDVILDDGKAVPLSRRLYNDVNRAFIDYYKGGK